MTSAWEGIDIDVMKSRIARERTLGHETSRSKHGKTSILQLFGLHDFEL
jgi:hypothetical protein